MKKRFTEVQVISFLREVNARLSAKAFCRKRGFSRPNYYACKAEYGGMNVPGVQGLDALE